MRLVSATCCSYSPVSFAAPRGDGSQSLFQQPLSEAPGMVSLRFTEPPSVDGTAGPQIGPVAAASADDAVVLAALEDEFGASPGSWRAVSGLLDEGALIDPDEFNRAAVPMDDPLGVELVGPLVADAPAGDPVAAVPAPPADVCGIVEADVVPPLGLVVAVIPDVAPLDLAVAPEFMPCVVCGAIV
jgi:hypothetical protein